MDDGDNFDEIIKSTFNDMNRLFSGMDSLFKSFIFDSENNQLPNISGFNNNNNIEQSNENSLRDQYLKKDDQNSFHSTTPNFFNFPRLPPFNFDNFKIENSSDNFDEVLDDKFKKNETTASNSLERIPRFYSHSKSYSVRRIQRPDGSIEEITTSRDSTGKEETRVTRTIGEKSHSYINRKSNDGSLNETEEIFQNIEQDNIEEFNKIWKNPIKFNHDAPIPKNPPLPNNQEQSDAANNENSLLSKFVSWFKK